MCIMGDNCILSSRNPTKSLGVSEYTVNNELKSTAGHTLSQGALDLTVPETIDEGVQHRGEDGIEC
jgi:hypothetical protein